MATKRKKTREIYSTVTGDLSNRTKKQWIIILFILMIVTTIVGFYIFFQYTSIEESYQTHLYKEELGLQTTEIVEDEKTKPYTVLVVALDNIYVDGSQIEEALWSTLFYVTPEEKMVQAVSIPLNLHVESNEDDLNLDTYGSGGIVSIKENISELFEVQIDYLNVLRLQNIRNIIDPLESIQVQAPITVEGNNLKISSGKHYRLSGREIEQLMSLASTSPTLEQAKFHQAIIEGVISETFQFENVLQLPQLLSNGEFVFQSGIPFSKLVEIYRNDDYNLTTVDLGELIELNLTQLDNRDLYIADLVEVKEVVQRMTTAIQETAQ